MSSDTQQFQTWSEMMKSLEQEGDNTTTMTLDDVQLYRTPGRLNDDKLKQKKSRAFETKKGREREKESF